ncbi:hypothetical protein AAEU33_04410 [Chryseobacterium sp. Chry.R1]|uniref:hypothetical protein n=1 Tax=Chryseobacterium sp. Chry.R1 TaxID=3139392 RepID=UPI0031F954AD
MKSLYIIALLLSGLSIYAQENKTSEPQDQALILKNAKEQEAKLIKDYEQYNKNNPPHSGLVSDYGLEVKKQNLKPKNTSDNSGKLLPNTASFDEVLATIPNRRSRKASQPINKKITVTGLSNTATLEEIKKTIPRN